MYIENCFLVLQFHSIDHLTVSNLLVNVPLTLFTHMKENGLQQTVFNVAVILYLTHKLNI